MEQLKILLLLALPASGKSEVRKFLRSLPFFGLLRDFGIGPTIQLDDYPYVHLMRRVDEELVKVGKLPIFFSGADKPFRHPTHWVRLIRLLNEDFACLGSEKWSVGQSPIQRITSDEASLFQCPASIEMELRDETDQILTSLQNEFAKDTEGATVIMEFARGGPVNATMPLPYPIGYQHSLAALSPDILRQASILYVDVDPAHVRQKNRDRMPPPDFKGDTGIFHFVPEEVMDNDYGCDDINYLLSVSDRPNTVQIYAKDGNTYYLPCARFNNRDRDITSFARHPESKWKFADSVALHAELKSAFSVLAAAQANR